MEIVIVASDPVRVVGCDDPGPSSPVRIVNFEDLGIEIARVRAGDVDAGDYTQIDDEGLFLFGDARQWVDFNFGVGALGRGASAPDLINLGGTNIEVLGFNGINTTEEVSVLLEMDHMWAQGTAIYPHVHWMASTAAAGNVKWQIEYVVVEMIDGDLPAATTIAIVQAAPGVAWRTAFQEFAPIVMTGFTMGSQVVARLFRDPTDGQDTYGADAALLSFGFHVLVNSLGSRERLVK